MMYGAGDDEVGRARKGKAEHAGRWKKILAKLLVFAVNYAQGMHTLIARRRQSMRQDLLLPAFPMF